MVDRIGWQVINSNKLTTKAVKLVDTKLWLVIVVTTIVIKFL